MGIRRASQLKSGGNLLVPSGLQLNSSSVMDVINAVSTRCAFCVCYNPRYCSASSLELFWAGDEKNEPIWFLVIIIEFYVVLT